MPATTATRTSTHISAAAFRQLYQSTALANCDGMVLNKFITVAWDIVGPMDPATNWRCHQKLLELVRTWFNDRQEGWYQPLPLACVWVRERGTKFGLHSHLLLHVDPFLDVAFSKWLKRAVPRIAEKALGALPEAYDGQLLHFSPNRGQSTEHQWRIFRYLMKGLDPEATIAASGERHIKYLLAEFGALKPRAQGEIVGARCGRSRYIGAAKQKWAATQFDLPDLWPTHRLDGRHLPYDDRFLSWWADQTSSLRLREFVAQLEV